MKNAFDEERTIRALDKLFRENEELKARISLIERQLNAIYEMDKTGDGHENKNQDQITQDRAR